MAKKKKKREKKNVSEASSLTWTINKKGLSDTLYGRKKNPAQRENKLAGADRGAITSV